MNIHYVASPKFSCSTCSVLSATCRAHLFFSTGSSITHWEGWWWTTMVKKHGNGFGKKFELCNQSKESKIVLLMLLIFSFSLLTSILFHWPALQKQQQQLQQQRTCMMGPRPSSLRASYNYLDSMPLCTTSSTIMVVIISDGYCYWRLILQFRSQSPLQGLCGLHALCSTSHPYSCTPLQRMETAI